MLVFPLLQEAVMHESTERVVFRMQGKNHRGEKRWMYGLTPSLLNEAAEEEKSRPLTERRFIPKIDSRTDRPLVYSCIIPLKEYNRMVSYRNKGVLGYTTTTQIGHDCRRFYSDMTMKDAEEAHRTPCFSVPGSDHPTRMYDTNSGGFSAQATL